MTRRIQAGDSTTSAKMPTLAEALTTSCGWAGLRLYVPIFQGDGDHDGAVESGQHALAVAETSEISPCRSLAHHCLGVAYHVLGDHRRAMGLLRSNVESLAGDLLRERFGLAGLLPCSRVAS